MRFLKGRLLAVLTLFMAAGGAAFAAEPPACHGEPSQSRLLLTVEGVRSAKGHVVANLYGASRRRWLADNGWLDVWRDPAEAGDMTMCLYLPGPGSYALVVFQDANDNGDLDVGPFGPREGYGFSNNVRPFLMAPSLKSASFQAGLGDTRLRIRLHYP